uniref:Uncharacterized protein n=1 Tax=Vitis vinifera TaxID=29760 RepID=F6HZS1_VITVI
MPPPALGPGHKRSQSEVVTGKHRRSNSFHRWKSHMQRALRWGSNPQDQGSQSTFNPEILANQKRQWYQLHSKTPVYEQVSRSPLASLGRTYVGRLQDAFFI